MKKYAILTAIALIVSLGTLLAQTTVNKSFTGVKRIKMSTGSGDCEIKKSSGATVEIEMKHTYDQNAYSPRFEQTGDRLTISESRNQNNYNGTSYWKISIPDGVTVDYTTGSGNLTVTGVNVNIDANSGSGDLVFSSFKGEIDANTGSGDVEVASYSGPAKINTGSGNMDVTDTDGELDLNCGSGDIKVTTAKGYFAINTGSGNINANKITINESSRFNTGSGRAKLTLAASPKSDITINSGSGNAEVNFGGNEISGEVVMRANKRNGRITAPFEFDKTEEERNGNGDDNVTIVKTAQVGKGKNRISIGTGSGDAILNK